MLRLLDANANRAREALRVLEDYARFVLGNTELCAALKETRHELTGALKDVLPEAILHRDISQDAGRDNTTAAEMRRADLAEVVVAAGKRLGEALRAIEEYLKTMNAQAAANVEQVRYRFYELEQAVARTLHTSQRMGQVRLCVLITESLCRRPWLQAAEEAIRGGADCLQLREKSLAAGELLQRAIALAKLCRRHGVMSIINDRPDIALLSGVDGVHVGQEDLPAALVRKLVGRQMIVGVSTHRLEQARKAVLDGADYLGAGPVFPSATKPRDFVAGLEYARDVAAQIPLPALAISGITQDNVDQVVATGIGRIAVTAAVIACADVRGAAARLKAKLTAGIKVR